VFCNDQSSYFTTTSPALAVVTAIVPAAFWHLVVRSHSRFLNYSFSVWFQSLLVVTDLCSSSSFNSFVGTSCPTLTTFLSDIPRVVSVYIESSLVRGVWKMNRSLSREQKKERHILFKANKTTKVIGTVKHWGVLKWIKVSQWV
jgi:hypothetical protein